MGRTKEVTLTLSGSQLVSVQPQSLVDEDVVKPAGQVRVEFWQLHAHSKESQQLVFLTDSRRCAGHTGGDCWVHSSFLQTTREGRFNCNGAKDCSLNYVF